MNFNFYDQYRVYSNVELLRIISRADEYQPEAVEAASLVLKDRNVTEEERAEVEQFFADKNAKAEKIEAYKDKAKDFFQPIVQPEEDVKPAKWLNIVLLLVAVDFLWEFYRAVKDTISRSKCADCPVDPFSLLLSISGVVYLPVIFYLLLKRRRWGWILLFADNGISVLLQLSQAHIFFKYQDMHGSDTTAFLLPVLIRLGFLVFLWRNDISGYFGVSMKTKQHVLIFLAVVAVLAFGFSFF